MDKKNIQDILSLTPTQEGILYHYLKEPQRNLYYVQLCLETAGELDVHRFTAAWNFVVKTNEMLRASFRWEQVKAPLQIILKESSLEVHYYDFSDKPPSQKNSALEEVKKQDQTKGFDLKGTPFRVTLCKMEQALYQMIISHHHILYDGWSSGIILTEFFQAYHHICAGKAVNRLKTPGKTRFKEFLKSKAAQEVEQGKKAQEAAFWKEYLADFQGETAIPIKTETIPGKEEPGETRDHDIDLEAPVNQLLQQVTARNNITPAVLLYSVWGLLLHKYSNRDDVIFGTTVSGRTAKIPGIENMVGLFVNTLPLRIRFNPGGTIREMLRDLSQALRDREAYENTPLARVMQYSRGNVMAEPFHTIVVVENYPLEIRLKQQTGPLTVTSYTIKETAHYDITLVIGMSESIHIRFSYQSQAFSEETIKRMGSHFLRILRIILENLNQDIFKIDILSHREKRQILEEFNNTEADYPRHKTIYRLFAEQAGRTPDNIALARPMQKKNRSYTTYTTYISYRQLNESAHQLAHILQERGTGPDVIVGIMTERSIEMVIGILAILKAGGAYLPIDPEYPQERINFMLADSNAEVFITTPGLWGEHEEIKIVNCQREIVYSAQSKSPFEGGASSTSLKKFGGGGACLNLQPATRNSQLAYVIYTSGSTGKPKGVLVNHSSVVNLVYSQQNHFDITENDRILQFSTICFDASVEQFFIALSTGAALVLIEKDTLLDSGKFDVFIFKHGITHIHAVPSFLNRMELNNQSISPLKRVISGGDVCPPGLAKKWSQYCDFYNEYGPTETTVTSIEILIKSNTVAEGGIGLPIGKPIKNTVVYLLDRGMKPVPPGVVGEMYIGGAGVARGYLNRPELTAEKFILVHSSWFIADRKEMKEAVKFPMSYQLSAINCIYKTGDRARWQPDGNIEFLGRTDHQVKIRGFRIELGEIEAQLVKHDAIKETLVVTSAGDAVADAGDKFLCAYIVPHSSTLIPGELKTYLGTVLPVYMIPTYFVKLESFPLTPNGKIDRQALPLPGIKTATHYTAPRDNIEKKLAEIWAQILNINQGAAQPGAPPIGIEDNFFQIGGHSLKAARLMTKIHRVFNVRIPLAEVLARPTIKEMAQFIRGSRETRYLDIAAVEQREYYSLSPAQKRLFIVQRTHPDSIAYNISTVLLLEGDLGKKRLDQAFARMIQRHESLRTSFAMVEDEPVQRVHEKVEFEIEYSEVKVKVEEEIERTRGLAPLFIEPASGNSQPETVLIRSFIQPFDLSRAPLVRVGLVKVEEKKFFLMLDMHHIISDGMSAAVMVKEFTALYRGETLPIPVTRYRDYAQWLKSDTWKKTIKKQENYWLQVYEKEVPQPDLPVDYARPMNRRYEGDRLIFEIGEEDTNRLKALAVRQEMTLFMVLLAIYNVLLGKLGGRADIVVGTGTAGRNHESLYPVIGMFVNTLALRNYPREQETFKEFLKQVRESTLRAFENQDYPFEDLAEWRAKPASGRNPLFDVMFQMENIDGLDLEIPGIKVNPLEIQRKVSKFDLTLRALEKQSRLVFSMEYNSRLYEAGTISYFARYYKEFAAAAAAGPDRTLEEITAVSGTRKQEILSRLNTTLEHETREFEKKIGNTVIQARINRWVKKSTHSTAIENGNRIITRERLNRRANHIASGIHQKGIQKNSFIGILIEDREEFIAVVLGILKVGCVFVPLDSSLPPGRLERMIAVLELRYVIVEAAGDKQLPAFNRGPGQRQKVEFIFHHRPNPGSPQGETARTPQPPVVTHGSRDNVYVYFTSGSTGRPKAIVGKNRSLLHFIHWEIETLGIQESIRVSQLINPGFDAFLRDIFVPLCTGGVICIPGPREIIRDPVRLTRWIDKSGIQLIHCVPAFFRLLMSASLTGAQLKTLKYILLSGERINPADLAPWYAVFNQRIKLVNLWGSTETTMAKTCYFIKESDGQRERIPVGKPIKGANVMVLDQSMNICDVLITGELYIRTPYRTFGYYNDPGANARYFIPNPFGNNAEVSGEQDIISKTGDLGRLLPDGNIELLGRKDFQVKIRGIRVELGEIENCIQNHPGIKETVVLARQDSGDYTDIYLCAYVVPVDKGTFTSTPAMTVQLKNYLSDELPDYMIPSYFIQLEKMPLTANGKIDRKALPPPETKTGTPYAPPGDDIEKKLVEIWSGVLGREKNRLGIDDNFFEMGGHSLKAVILTTKLQKEYNLKLALTEIFEKPTIRGTARYIRDKTRNQPENKYTLIKPVEKRDYYGLSSAQKRLYFLQRMDPGSTGYNRPLVSILQGRLERNRLETAIKKLINRHESLRTSFEMVENEPIQRIAEKVKVGIKNERFEGTRGLAPLTLESAARGGQLPKSQELRAKSFISSFIRPFDLSKAPLLRVELEEIEEDRYIFLMDMHHIISDGVSDYKLSRDFMALYWGEGQDGLPLRLQYKDYVLWQGEPEQRALLEKQETFWTKQYQDQVPVLNLPIDNPRPAIRDFSGRRLMFQISEQRLLELKKLAARESVTLYMLLLALYNIFLQKITSQEDIVVGTPVAGRPHPDLQEIVGFFVNTLPLRSRPKPGKTFRQFLAEVKTFTTRALENQEYPFERLVDQLGVKRDTSRNPLFDAVFAILNFERTDIRIPGLILKPYQHEITTSKFDLALQGMDQGQGFVFMMEYSDKIFNTRTIERYKNYFLKLLCQVSAGMDISIAEMEILPRQEKRQLLEEFNETRSPYPADKTIHELFAQQIEQTPDHTAVVGPAKMKNRTYKTNMTYISYRELNEASRQLARLLEEKGVQPGAIVANMMERSLELIIVLLAILKAGAAYLPIDPAYPQERIEYMLKDSGAKILLTSDAMNRVPTPHHVSLHTSNLSSSSTLTSTCQVSPANLAYIIYTSGSTGWPKGVMIDHQNVLRLVKQTNFIVLGERERLLMTGSIAFDISTFEIWGSLLNGLTLFLTTPPEILELEQLTGIVKKHQISILHLIPQLFNQTAAENPEIFTGLKYFLVGGDLVIPHYVNQLRERYPRLKILHMYGPTENTTFSTYFPVEKTHEHRLPIGRPIANTTIYILDARGGLVPIGVTGELCVGGHGISRGYLNQPQLTSESFNHDLWVRTISNKKFLRGGPGGALFSKSAPPGRRRQKIYKTGDLGRWLPDGNIEFLGRCDNQVKIRGIRIEMQEIENQLSKHEKIKEAAVIINEQQQYLCAYVVPEAGEETRQADFVTELKEFLSQTLPLYMIPHHFILLNKMPLAANGKLDRKSLPEPRYKPGDNYTAPQNPQEKKLVQIWSAVLGIEESMISIDADFFELGGHSLRVFTLVNEIHKTFEVRVPLPGVFQNPTIRSQSAYINAFGATGRERFIPIQVAEEKEYYPLSSSQRQFYILQYAEKESTAYNVRSVLWLEAALDRQKMEKTFQVLIKRHEVLRTFFLVVNLEPVQVIKDHVAFKIDYYDFQETGAGDQCRRSSISAGTGELAPVLPEPAAKTIKNFIRPFDLSKAPLFRVGLIKVEKEKHIFLVDMHHIVTDGTSMNILIKEFNYHYSTGAEEKLPSLKLRYRDFSQWQHQEKQGGEIKRQQQWWQKEFPRQEDIPVLNLPLDYERKPDPTSQGGRMGFLIDEKETAALKALAAREKITLFMVLLALCNVLLSKVCQQEEIVLGAPAVVRQHADLAPVIGLFLNTLALRNFPSGEKTFREFLKEVKLRTLNAFRNQDYPYEELVTQLFSTNPGRGTIFDFLFVLQNTGTANGFGSGHGYQCQYGDEYIPGTVPSRLTFKPYRSEDRPSPFDMIFLAYEIQEKLDCSIYYRTELFKPETIQRIIDNFKEIFAAVIQHNDILLQDIAITHDWQAASSGGLLEDKGDFGF